MERQDKDILLKDEYLHIQSVIESFDGRMLTPGTYVCEMEMEGFIAVRKITLLG